MNAEEAIKHMGDEEEASRSLASGCTKLTDARRLIHNAETFKAIAALIRRQTDDLAAIEGAAWQDGFMAVRDLASKTYSVSTLRNRKIATARGPTLADACRAATKGAG